MPTFRQIITDALSDINQLGAGETPTDVEASHALRLFRSMMDGWRADGLVLTRPAVGDAEPAVYESETIALTDTFPLAEAFVEGVQAMLAVRLSPLYGNQIDPALLARARKGRARLNDAFFDEPTLQTDLSLRRTTGRHYRYLS